jgi:8-oxo-dGTP diphosphatase
MSSRSVSPRATARAFVLSVDGRVLLIRHVVERGGEPFIFWATPGGGIQPNETPQAAVAREVREELGLDLMFDGPVYETHSEYSHEGVSVVNTDTFFVARCDQSSISLDGITAEEKRALAEARWWTIAELEMSDERVFPPDLGAVLRTLAIDA